MHNVKFPIRILGTIFSSLFIRLNFRYCLYALLLIVVAQPSYLLAGKKYALVIGISRYKNEALQSGIVNLDYADADAISMAALLRKGNFIFPGALTNNDAERGDILSEIVRLRSLVTKDDLILIYFAGHGARDPFNNKTYLLTSDTELNNIEDKGIRLEHLMDYINDLKAERKIILLDHCYSGEIEYIKPQRIAGRATRNSKTHSLKPRGITAVETSIKKAISGSGTVLVAATGSTDELRAFEHPSIGHGFFTQAIIDAANTQSSDTNNNGKLEILELLEFIPSRVEELTNTHLKIDQSPKIVLHEAKNIKTWESLFPISVLIDKKEITDFLDELIREKLLSEDDEFKIRRAIVKWEEGSHSMSNLTEKNRLVMENLKKRHAFFKKYPDDIKTIAAMLAGGMTQIFGADHD